MPARPLKHFTHASSILEHGQYLLKLQAVWRQLLPAAMSEAARVGAFDGQTMTIYAKNGAIAAKLKQQQPTLLKKLQARGVQAVELHISVKVHARPAARPPGAPRRITAAGRQEVASLAETLPDSPLKKALERMLARQATDANAGPGGRQGGS